MPQHWVARLAPVGRRTLASWGFSCLAALVLSGCSYLAVPQSTSATATSVHASISTPTQTPTPTADQIQQQKAKAVATYCALFEHGIPSLLTSIPVELPNPNGQKVEIGEQFSGAAIPDFQLRVVVPLYAFVTIQNGKLMVDMTFGTRENEKCATFDFVAPPSAREHVGHPSEAGEFDLFLGGRPIGGPYNAYPGYRGDMNDITYFLGLPKDSSSLDIAEADARLITTIGAHMLGELANPIIGNTPGNKVASYLSLPVDSKYKFAWLWLPHTDLCSFDPNTCNLG